MVPFLSFNPLEMFLSRDFLRHTIRWPPKPPTSLSGPKLRVEPVSNPHIGTRANEWERLVVTKFRYFGPIVEESFPVPIYSIINVPRTVSRTVSRWVVLYR